MIDPVSALTMAVTAYNGIKQAAKVGKEIHEIYGELSKWASHMSDLYEFLSQEEKKPSIFKKLEFNSSDTAEAFNVFAARQQVKQMEEDIRFMFLYGDLNHLGIDGYRELISIRREIKLQREKVIYDHNRRKQKFIYNVKLTILLAFTAILCVGIIWGTIALITSKGQL